MGKIAIDWMEKSYDWLKVAPNGHWDRVAWAINAELLYYRHRDN